MIVPGPLAVLVKQVEGKPSAMVRLAKQLLAMNQGALARDLCAQAVALAPEDGEVRALAFEVLSHGVAPWHFHMVRDEARNGAYERALCRAIKPGFLVLEIGTGSGLLAMMAARAGADEVVTCEANPVIADAAREIVARNGFSGRIRVIAKHSSDLEIGVDITEPADLLVSEIVSNNLIGEGVLPVTENAVRRLLKPGAPIIPARGAIRVALAQDPIADHRRMDVVSGFDLSPFNRLAQPRYMIGGRDKLALRSAPGSLFSFNFQSGGPFPEARAKLALESSGGVINGIAQWIQFDLDDEDRYENSPPTKSSSSWSTLFYPLAAPLETALGDIVTVCGTHDRASISVWTEKSA